MERPTCKTCPYWDTSFFDEGDRQGHCKRYPPRVVPDGICLPGLGESLHNGLVLQGKQSSDGKPLVLYQIWTGDMIPVLDRDEWCGEHPYFPAWIAALKDGTAVVPED